MPDPTSLLDTMGMLLGDISCWIKSRSHQEMHSSAMRVGHSYAQLPPDAIAQLRAMVRSDAETEVLRAALSWEGHDWSVSNSIIGGAHGASLTLRLGNAVRALPPDELARLGGAK